MEFKVTDNNIKIKGLESAKEKIGRILKLLGVSDRLVKKIPQLRILQLLYKYGYDADTFLYTMLKGYLEEIGISEIIICFVAYERFSREDKLFLKELGMKRKPITSVKINVLGKDVLIVIIKDKVPYKAWLNRYKIPELPFIFLFILLTEIGQYILSVEDDKLNSVLLKWAEDEITKLYTAIQKIKI